MKRFDYNFTEYQKSFNKMARDILAESYGEQFDAEKISEEMDEAQVTYNKIQKILNCPEMIKSHAYLYSLDMENVDECDKKKIDNLYELGKARGVIQEDEPNEDDGQQQQNECDDGQICGGPNDALTGQEMVPGDFRPSEQSAAFTILYSAMKDGKIKTGEFFSSATDADSAKQDCMSNLAPLGYSNIRVLGIEQTDNSVDMQNSTLDGLDEDDSQEYENQETGAEDTSADDSSAEGDSGKDKDKDKDKEGSGESGKEDSGDAQDKGDQSGDSSADGGASSDFGSEEKGQEDGETSADGENADGGSDEAEGTEEQKKKLTTSERQVLRDEYVGMFKSELQKTKLEKSVEEMSIKEKADFWGTIAKKWTKQEPEEFMSAKEIEKLNNTVIKN